MLTVGNDKYIEWVRKRCYEIVELLCIEHTEDQREQMSELSSEDLYELLDGILEDNELFVEHPN